MSDTRTETFNRIAGMDRKKARALAERQEFIMFARDGVTPLPTLITTKEAMEKNKSWVAALLAFNLGEEEKTKP
jgi:hypothetical protein